MASVDLIREVKKWVRDYLKMPTELAEQNLNRIFEENVLDPDLKKYEENFLKYEAAFRCIWLSENDIDTLRQEYHQNLDEAKLELTNLLNN